MKCPQCGYENKPGKHYCTECGAKIRLRCPQCNSEIEATEKFCGSCGFDLKTPTNFSDFNYLKPHSYTPKFLADKILTTRSSIEGERKLVTVLFADVANYTSIAEKLDPEEIHQIMDECFKILMNAIHKYEGTVNQFTGDGIMALFGAPVAHEDHAQRACLATLSIQKALEKYANSIRKDFGADFKMRIGLNSGPVIVGSIGDDLRMDYTAIGDTTNLAARFEGMAKPGKCLVSSHTHKLARDFFEFESLGKVRVKGKELPQEVFELTKKGKAESRIEASVAKGLTPFVGRKNSIVALMEAFEKTQSGTGQIVGVVGDAGVGKSRLLLEFKDQLPQDEIICLEGQCLPFGSAMAYLPLLDILRSFFEIKEFDQEDLIKKNMGEKILLLDRKLQSVLPPFHELLSLVVEDEAYQKLEPMQKREKIFEAIRDLLIHESQSSSNILIVEDLHWIDKTSEEFLSYLIEWLANSRIMLILLYRPEYTHPWGSKSYYNRIGLDKLTENSSTELIQAILKEGDPVPELRDLILHRAAGNPLYMEEFTHTLLENGFIVCRDQKCELVKNASEIQVPDSIQGIIAARMDRLEDNLKQTIQVAAVIGRNFAFRILETITGLNEELKSDLLKLQGLEFIYEKRLFPELEYVFKHALTQEVAYNSLLKKKKRAIHEKIGKAIQELYPRRLEEFYEVLAFHYTNSENSEKAFHYLRLSGDKSSRNHSLQEAIRFYKHAIDLLNKQPETEEIIKNKLQVLLSMSIPLRVAGYPHDSLLFLQEGERAAKYIGDEKILANFYSQIGNFHATRGNTELAQEYEENCFRQAEKIQDVELMAPVAYDLCNVYALTGEFAKVIDMAPKVIQLLEKTKRQAEFFSRPDNVYSELCGYYGLVLGVQGSFRKGAAFCEKSLRHATEIGDLRTIGFSENMFGHLYLARGDWQFAIDHFQLCIEHFEKAQWLWPLSIAYSGLVHAYSFLKDRVCVFKYYEKVHRLLQESQIELFSSFQYWMLGKAFLNLDDLKNAQSCSEKALKLSQNHHGKWDTALALMLFGEISAKTGNKHDGNAKENIFQGIRILEKLELRPFYSIGFFTLGELYFRTNRKDNALEYLKKAEKMFQVMEMDYWLATTQEVLDSLKI